MRTLKAGYKNEINDVTTLVQVEEDEALVILPGSLVEDDMLLKLKGSGLVVPGSDLRVHRAEVAEDVSGPTPPPEPPDPPPSIPTDPTTPLEPTDVVDNVEDLLAIMAGGPRNGNAVCVKRGVYRADASGFSISVKGTRDNPLWIYAEDWLGCELTRDLSEDNMIQFERESEHVNLMGFDIRQKSGDRISSNNSNAPEGVPMGRNVDMRGNYCGVIHCLIRDGRTGIGNTVTFSEGNHRGQGNRVYGNVIMNNGWLDQNGRGNGVQLYFQHIGGEGFHVFENNFAFRGFHYQLCGQWYGSRRAWLNSFSVNGNTFAEGSNLFGGLTDGEDCHVFQNFFVDSGIRHGYSAGMREGDSFNDNCVLLVNEEQYPYAAAFLFRNKRGFFSLQRNKIATATSRSIVNQLWFNEGPPQPGIEVVGNRWVGRKFEQVQENGGEMPGHAFQHHLDRTQATGDEHLGEDPAVLGTHAKITASPYWDGLTHVSILNYQWKTNTIGKIPGNVAPVGKRVEIHNAFNVIDEPVMIVENWPQEGVYIELSGQKRLKPFGDQPSQSWERHPGACLGAFVLKYEP